METVVFELDFAAWQKAARRALERGLSPQQIIWQPGGDAQAGLDLFKANSVSPSEDVPMGPTASPQFRVPRSFVPTAKLVACHRDETRWALLYRVLWRLTHAEPHLLEIATDRDVIELEAKAKDIRRDVHKMRAFVRFREVVIEGESWFVAWFEPHHHIVELNASFFVDRFASMNWSILTPDRCVHWDRRALAFAPGVTRDQAPTEDMTEDLWRTYYRNIFNPARVKVGAMKKEMAQYYWHNLPEAKIIPELLADAPKRVERMVAASRAKKPALEG